VPSNHSAAQHSTAQHSTAQRSTAQHSTAQHSTAQHSTAQHSPAQHTPAQPSPAQPSPDQPSTAQPSPAQQLCLRFLHMLVASTGYQLCAHVILIVFVRGCVVAHVGDELFNGEDSSATKPPLQLQRAASDCRTGHNLQVGLHCQQHSTCGPQRTLHM